MERRNLREASYCHYVITNIIYCSYGSYERNVSVQTSSQIILTMHRLFPLLEGSQLVQHASSDEAHGAVNSASSWIRGPREAAPQAMGPGDVLAPALPYSLGPISPSRHQQREEEG